MIEFEAKKLEMRLFFVALGLAKAQGSTFVKC